MAIRPRTGPALGAQAVAQMLEADGEFDRRCSGAGLVFDPAPLPPPAPPAFEIEPPDWPPVPDRVPDADPPRPSALAEIQARDLENNIDVFDAPPDLPPFGPPIVGTPLLRVQIPEPDWRAEEAAARRLAGPPNPAPRRRRRHGRPKR